MAAFLVAGVKREREREKKKEGIFNLARKNSSFWFFLEKMEIKVDCCVCNIKRERDRKREAVFNLARKTSSFWSFVEKMEIKVDCRVCNIKRILILHED